VHKVQKKKKTYTIKNNEIYVTIVEAFRKKEKKEEKKSFHPLCSFLVVFWQTNEILLNLYMKCWNSTFDVEGLRVSIIFVQIRAMKKICSKSGD